jgi:hypothetical protein
MSENDARIAQLVRLCETLVSEVATLKGYAEKHEAALESIDHKLGELRGALENQGNAIFQFSRELDEFRTHVLEAKPAKPIEHERIDRLSERTR